MGERERERRERQVKGKIVFLLLSFRESVGVLTVARYLVEYMSLTYR
jgi:hypothetical protein